MPGLLGHVSKLQGQLSKQAEVARLMRRRVEELERDRARLEVQAEEARLRSDAAMHKVEEEASRREEMQRLLCRAEANRVTSS
jgi:hypothetical protein